MPMGGLCRHTSFTQKPSMKKKTSLAAIENFVANYWPGGDFKETQEPNIQSHRRHQKQFSVIRSLIMTDT